MGRIIYEEIATVHVGGSGTTASTSDGRYTEEVRGENSTQLNPVSAPAFPLIYLYLGLDTPPAAAAVVVVPFYLSVDLLPCGAASEPFSVHFSRVIGHVSNCSALLCSTRRPPLLNSGQRCCQPVVGRRGFLEEEEEEEWEIETIKQASFPSSSSLVSSGIYMRRKMTGRNSR